MNKKDVDLLAEAYEDAIKDRKDLIKGLKGDETPAKIGELKRRRAQAKLDRKRGPVEEHHGDDFPQELLDKQITIGQLLDDLQPYLSLKETYDKLEEWLIHRYASKSSEGHFGNYEEAARCPVTGKMRKKKKGY